jgi:hypothetical protein
MSCLTATAEDGVRNVGKKNKFVGVPDIDSLLVCFTEIYLKTTGCPQLLRPPKRSIFVSSSASTIFPQRSFRRQSYRASS